MKKYYLYILTLLIFLGTGCTKKWLDVNTTPNSPSSATPELVLPAGIVSVTSTIGDYYTLIGGFWSQYWAQGNSSNQYKDYDAINVKSADVDIMWKEMYSGGLNDLQYVVDQSKESGNNAMLFIATVMQAYGFSFLVDYHDAVPYFDAFKGASNLSPKFDDGKTIYLDLIRRLDSTKVLDFAELTDAEKEADFIFGGNMDDWVSFANTLELRMYLRMVYSDPAEAQAGVEGLYADGANFLSKDAKLDIFTDVPYKDNPLYSSDRRNLNYAKNLRVSATIYDYFANNSDPRLAVISEAGLTNPMPQGGSDIPSTLLDDGTVPVFTLNATDPVYLISEVESYLLQSEAVMRGWGTGDDKALYDQGVLADFTRKGLDGSTFVATGGVYEYPSSGTDEQKLEAIIMAKWAAFAGNETSEAFFEFNRTGYPKIGTETHWKNGTYNSAYVPGTFSYPITGATAGEFAHRLIYPQSELNLNSNFPGQTKLTDKVWWNKK